MEHLLKRLAWTEPLREREKEQLSEAISDVRSFAARDVIVPADEAVNFSSVILEGLACREKVLASGERQITAFHLSGDFCDLHTYMLKTIPDSVKAITSCRVAMVPHDRLDVITSKSPRIAHLLWKSTLIDAAIYRRWLVCIGRQSALSRLSHLFCEFYLRFRLIGLTDGLSAATGPCFRAFSDAALRKYAAIALKEIEAFDSEARAKKNVRAAVEHVARQLGNTPAVCRKCYVHPKILDAYMDGTLIKNLAARSEKTLREKLSGLGPEEAAVLALLRSRLGSATRQRRDAANLSQQLLASVTGTGKSACDRARAA